MVHLCMIYIYIKHAYAHFDELDLDSRSQWVSRGKYSALNYQLSTKQVISIKPATTVGRVFFLHDLGLGNVYIALFIQILKMSAASDVVCLGKLM